MTDIKKTYLHGAKIESTRFESIVVEHMKQAGIDAKQAWVIAQSARQTYLKELKAAE
jgi:hypothetical protein